MTSAPGSRYPDCPDPPWRSARCKLQVSTDVILFIVGAFAVAALLSWLLTPVAIGIARRVGAIDNPDSARRVHRMPVARLGGLAVGATFVMWASWPSTSARGRGPTRPASLIRDPQLNALFLGVVVAMILGFIDDRWQIRARYQLVGQVGAGGHRRRRRHPVHPDRQPVPGAGRTRSAARTSSSSACSSSTSATPSTPSSRCPSCSRPSGSWA